MGKFDGYLLCTDLDDTLLSDDKTVSEENIKAINYFMSEGGFFAFSTGRVPDGIRGTLKYIKPNVPVVTFNGGSIYDFEKEEYLWSSYLGEGAKEVVEFVEREYPPAGIEICTAKGVNFSRINPRVEEHRLLENVPPNNNHYTEVKEPWQKVIFIMEPEYMQGIKELIAKTNFFEKFLFLQSAPYYYELLPLGMTKGTGVLKLAEILGIKRDKLIAVGDNDNDAEMVKVAGIGVAVANAVESVKNNADWMVADNNHHAIAKVIEKIENELN